MNTRLASAFSRRSLLALVATVSVSAALLSAHPAMAAVQGNADRYTQGAVAKADPYTDGAAKADPYTDGAAAKFDPYTQGADRQADTYGYLSWNGDKTYPRDPYTQGADRQADTYGYLSWSGDTSYPKDAASRA